MEIESFDSFEDMMQRMQEQMQAADSRVQPWQTTVKPGDYFRNSSGYGFNIYGIVREQYSDDKPHLKHYRFCECFSVACPEGELGDVHVSTIEQILEEAEFEAARIRGWSDG